MMIKVLSIGNSVILFLLLILCVSCSIGQKTENVNLEEVQELKVPEEEKVPPITAMITEIEEVKGVQKYIYYKISDPDNKWYKEGLKGNIYNDVEMKELIGKFVVIKIHKKFTRGEIVELFYPIQPKAIVLVELDPRHYIK